MARHPDFPWLDAEDRDGVQRCLAAQSFLKTGEAVEKLSKAGDGNMNLTLLVETNQRAFILKQARPWVEKYDDIAAPWDRILFEQRYYQLAAAIPEVLSRSPEILAVDAESRTILMENIEDAQDLTGLYTGTDMSASEFEALGRYLGALHSATRGTFTEDLANRDMRALNHEHIFVIPLAPDNGLRLDEFESGLMDAAAKLQSDAALCDAVSFLGERYLADGDCLQHGDYFPGSWLRSAKGLRVIDPEFCFYGDPEFDLGVAIAHLAIARRPASDAARFLSAYETKAAVPDGALLARYAGTEIIRRIVGVAQLPIPASTGFRSKILDSARSAVLESSYESLWER